jgi:hypothetical protein
MASISRNLQLKGLGAKAMTQLTSKAKRLGVTPERYVRKLVEADLAMDRKARSTSLADLMGPGRAVDDTKLDEFVDAARTRHHRRTTRR